MRANRVPNRLLTDNHGKFDNRGKSANFRSGSRLFEDEFRLDDHRLIRFVSAFFNATGW